MRPSDVCVFSVGYREWLGAILNLCTQRFVRCQHDNYANQRFASTPIMQRSEHAAKNLLQHRRGQWRGLTTKQEICLKGLKNRPLITNARKENNKRTHGLLKGTSINIK